MAGDPCPRSPQALLAAGSFVSVYHPRLWDLVPRTAPGWAGTQLDSWALGGCALSRSPAELGCPARIPLPSGSPAFLHTVHAVGQAGVGWLQGPVCLLFRTSVSLSGVPLYLLLRLPGLHTELRLPPQRAARGPRRRTGHVGVPEALLNLGWPLGQPGWPYPRVCQPAGSAPVALWLLGGGGLRRPGFIAKGR